MRYMLPTNATKILTRLLQRKIVQVRRQLFTPDLWREDYEQAADGPVELRLNDGYILHFTAWTEADSVGVVEGEMPRYGDSYELQDLTDNHFWRDRINQIIDEVQIFGLKDYDSGGECIEIHFGNDYRVCVEYLSEENFLDMVRVTPTHQGDACLLGTLS